MSRALRRLRYDYLNDTIYRSTAAKLNVSFRSFSKVSALSLTSKKRQSKKITVVTAYDFPSSVHVVRAGIDVLLVGDSAAMVELGLETTQPMTLDEMLHHCRAVKRGVDFAAAAALAATAASASGNVHTIQHPPPPRLPLLVADMPFGTYEYEDTDIALRNSYRFVKEAGVDAVKIEGGSAARARTAQKIVDGGVAVMGHVGLTPQAISVIGGFRAQGRTALRARALMDEALRLQEAGVFAIVLECMPANVAEAITETLEIPTIGIGAGPFTSGQVLVFHDMLGMLSHPHHEQFVPKFCKRYAHVGHSIQSGLKEFREEVESGAFPGDLYDPYVMTEKEKEAFNALLTADAEERRRKHELTSVKLTQADEYEQLRLYGSSNGNTNEDNVK